MKGTIENFVEAGQRAQAAVDAQLAVPHAEAESGLSERAIGEPLDGLPANSPETLFCQICQQPIAEPRAQRQTSTCSEKCKNRLDTIRANQRRVRKCPYCLHPGTPSEREEFRKWRESRGDSKVAFQPRDRTGTTKHDLRDAVKSATGHLEHVNDLLAFLAADPAMQTLLKRLPKGFRSREDIEKRLGRVRSRVQDFKALIDNEAEPTKLSP